MEVQFIKTMSDMNKSDEEGWIEVKPKKRGNRPKRDTKFTENGNANTRGNMKRDNQRGQSRGGARGGSRGGVRGGRGGFRGPAKHDANSGGPVDSSGAQKSNPQQNYRRGNGGNGRGQGRLANNAQRVANAPQPTNSA